MSTLEPHKTFNELWSLLDEASNIVIGGPQSQKTMLMLPDGVIDRWAITALDRATGQPVDPRGVNGEAVSMKPYDRRSRPDIDAKCWPVKRADFYDAVDRGIVRITEVLQNDGQLPEGWEVLSFHDDFIEPPTKWRELEELRQLGE